MLPPCTNTLVYIHIPGNSDTGDAHVVKVLNQNLQLVLVSNL